MKNIKDIKTWFIKESEIARKLIICSINYIMSNQIVFIIKSHYQDIRNVPHKHKHVIEIINIT